MNIKAICFDLDGVYFTSKGKNSFYEGLVSEYGIKKEVVDTILFRSPEMAQLVRGQIAKEEFWNKFRQITHVTASDKELTDRWIRDYEVNTSVQEVVLKLKQNGYKTCVCTNNNSIRLPILLEKYNLSIYFDVIVSSHQVGFVKPDKKIFEVLIEKLDIKPEELVYSDDNKERLQGATELGIKTFVYENFEQFLNELDNLGIKVN